MLLSAEDRAILAHVVTDPDAWADHASKEVGDWAVQEKIQKYRADYLAAKSAPGYRSKAERDTAAK